MIRQYVVWGTKHTSRVPGNGAKMLPLKLVEALEQDPKGATTKSRATMEQ